MKKKSSTHDSYIWLTGLGLSLGVLMVCFLLGLILINGINAFWPPKVAVFEKTDGQKIGGAIILKQAKPKQPDQWEWQIFRGNKEVFGQSFLFLDEKKINQKTTSYPEDIMVFERQEYGDAIGFPQKIVLPATENSKPQVILATDKQFHQILDQKVTEVNDRWDQIRVIEKNEIGSVNRKLEEIKLTRVRIKKDQIISKAEEKELAKLDKEEAKINQDYQKLADQAQKLRNQQKQSILFYTLYDGSTQKIELGQIVDFHFPNQLGFFGRIGHTLNGMYHFLITEPREANTEGGVFPALFGTFVMTIIMSLFVSPFGVLAAVYLREYAKEGLWLRMVRVAVNNLAGVPSIVFGVFGLGFFVYLVGGTLDELFFSDRLPSPTFGTGGILWASLTLALLTLPVVIVATEESLASVPRGMRESGLALGASKWQTIKRLVLPASAPGILTGMILAMARGAGEVAPLMIVGVVKLAPTLPINSVYPFVHLDQKFMHLGFHIYDLGFQSPDSEAAKPMVYATTLLLILMVVVLNLGAIMIRERLRRKYARSVF